jgi:general secretion pathway protein A
MYERFYNLRERPFALSPDPEYLYLSRVHGEALDSIRYGIESRAGFIVVTGEIGAGKTTLLQTVLQRLDDRMLVARIVNTMLEPRELIEAIALDFGLPDTSKSKPALLRDLGMFLVQQRTQGRRPLLVIDEAQNLSAQSLEEVRLLSNLETDKSKLLQIVLAGQPNLRDTIASPELEQFRQRVAVSYHLMPLDAGETQAYIKYRLDHAAVGEPPRFSPEACELIYQVSGGVPRLINVVCDATLVFGYAEERRSIDRALLVEVIRELEATGIIPPSSTRSAIAPAASPALAAAAMQPVDVPPAPAAAPVPSTVIATRLVAPTEPAAAATSSPFTATRPAAPTPRPATPTALPTTAAQPAVAVAAPATVAPPALSIAPPAAPVMPASPVAPAARPSAPPPAARVPSPATPGATPFEYSFRDRSYADGREPLQAGRQLVIASEAELAARSEAVARRQAELAAREEALLQRERQIAEQRRVMGEEYRLLRNTQTGRQAAVRPHVAAGRAAAAATGQRSRTTLTEPRAARLLPLWQRIVRIFTGADALRS